MNKNIKRTLLFVLLLTLMIGIASASEVSTDQHGTMKKQAEQNAITTTNQINNDETSKTIQEQKDKINHLENTIDTLNKTSTIKAIPENTTVGDSKVGVTLSNKLGDSIDNAPITVKNTKNETIGTGTTNSEGIAVINVKTLSGTENITVTYPGNDKLTPATYTTSITTVKHDVRLNVNPIKGVIGENITLTAHLADEHKNPVDGGNLVFKLNGKTLRTDGRFDSKQAAWKFKVKNGIVTTTIKADLYLRNAKNITASYSGSYKYNEEKSRTEIAQIKKRNAQLTITATPTTQKHYETITFTAKLKDTTKGHKNNTAMSMQTKVLFKINGITIKDKNGKKLLTDIKNNTATYKYTVPQVMAGLTQDGKMRNHTVEAVLISDTYYPDTRNKTYFHVERNPTKITINNIQASYKKNTTITGKLTDTHNKAISNTKIKLSINNKNYTIKTDNKGTFQKTIITDKVGTNNISAYYPGNTNYKATNTKTTFKVNKSKTTITFQITTKKIRAADDITIEGKIVDENKNPVPEAVIRINGTDEYYYPLSDSEGEFSSTFMTQYTVGKQCINLSYDGNENYAATSSVKYFTADKMELAIMINPIKPVKVGGKTVIDGRVFPVNDYLCDTPLKNITVNFRLNKENNVQKMILDKNNEFKFECKSNIIGTNNVTITLLENKDALGTKESDTFTVYNNTQTSITIPVKQERSTINRGYEEYETWIEDNIDINKNRAFIQINGYSYFPPVHKIVEAKFYLKDGENKTVTRNSTEISIDYAYLDYDMSLVPYKIDLQMKELSKYEQDNYSDLIT